MLCLLIKYWQINIINILPPFNNQMIDQNPPAERQPVVKKVEEDEQSQWSLSSIEQLKGLDLKQLQQQQDRQQNQVHKQKPEKQSKPKMTPLYPPAQEITSQSKLHEVGKIMSKVGQLLIVQSNTCINLVDFDNWLFNANKQCIGFVMDIFGRVDHPYYAIKMLQQVQKKVTNWQQAIGVSLYYAQGCKTLTQDDIKSIKQKSSVYKQGQVDDCSSEQEIENQSQQQMRSNQIMRKKQMHPPRRKASYQQQPFNYRERTREKKHHHHNNNNMHHPHYNPNNNPHHRERYQHEEGRRRHHNHGTYEDRQQAHMRDRHNQMYLQSMYTMYYNQMMQLYNGQNGMPLPKPPVGNMQGNMGGLLPMPANMGMNMSMQPQMMSNMQPTQNNMQQMPPMPGNMPPMPMSTIFPPFQPPHQQ